MIKNYFIEKTLTIVALLSTVACAPSYQEYEKKSTPCPEIIINKETSSITKIIDSNTLWEANLKGYKGFCSYSKDGKELNLDIDLHFDANLISPNTERAFTVKYYMAIPSLHPSPLGKQNFYLDVVFPQDKNQIDIYRKAINASFPLYDENDMRVDTNNLKVYIGIQLDKEQLAFNRKQKP